jgi:hypothetical protein
MYVKISLSGEEGVGHDEEENISDNSNMQNGIWVKSDYDRPRFRYNE